MGERRLHLTTPDGRVALAVRGEGPAALLLHGLSANRRTWDPLAELLEDEFTLFLPDLPSRGESEPQPELRYRYADELRRARWILDRLRPMPELLVGHSQGAALAVGLAAEGRARGLVLASPISPWTPRPAVLAALRPRAVRRSVRAAFLPFRRVLARLILRRVCGPETPVTRRMVDLYAEPYADPRRADALLRIVADWRPQELERHLPDRAPPTLVVSGERDPRARPEDAARLARRLGAPLWPARKAGHLLPDEAPALLARAVRAVYEEIREDGREAAG